uniref:Uncharacterized protein n=1 Tax=Parascaris equorum TaxID=6256 RepID=A0A914S5C0_PAREQ
MKRKRKAQDMGEKKHDDEDLEKLIDEEKMAREKQQLEALSAELKTMQKEYVKALRKPKEKKEDNDSKRVWHFPASLSADFY